MHICAKFHSFLRLGTDFVHNLQTIPKPGFYMIVTIVAITENGCDDPDDHMETSIFFLVTIVTIRIATMVEIVTSSISTIVAIKLRSSDDREFNGNHFCSDRYD